MNNIDDLQLSMNSYDNQILMWDKEGMAMDKQWSDSECSAGLRRFWLALVCTRSQQPRGSNCASVQVLCKT